MHYHLISTLVCGIFFTRSNSNKTSKIGVFVLPCLSLFLAIFYVWILLHQTTSIFLFMTKVVWFRSFYLPRNIMCHVNGYSKIPLWHHRCRYLWFLMPWCYTISETWLWTQTINQALNMMNILQKCPNRRTMTSFDSFLFEWFSIEE